MNEEPQATIRRQVAERAVERAQLWFTDDIGELEMVEIPSSRPDWSTFKILQGVRGTGKTAAVFCSLTSMGFVALDQHALA